MERDFLSWWKFTLFSQFVCNCMLGYINKEFSTFYPITHTHIGIIVTRWIFLSMHFAWETGVFQDFSGTRSCFQYRSTSIHHEFLPFLVSSITFNFSQIEEFSNKKKGMRWKKMENYVFNERKWRRRTLRKKIQSFLLFKEK